MQHISTSSSRQLSETIQGTDLNNLIGHHFFIRTLAQAYETIATFKFQFINSSKHFNAPIQTILLVL
jgi:hypothetical protein